MHLEQLLCAVRNNQPGALDLLMAELGIVLYAYFRGRRLPHDVADDLTQETMLVVLKKLPGLPENPGRPSLTAWLFTTARNKSLEQWRKDANHVETTLRRAEAIAAPGGSLSSQARLAELKVALNHGLAAMPDHLRDVADLDLNGGDLKAFAAANRLKEPTMRSRRKRYVEWLQDYFDNFLG